MPKGKHNVCLTASVRLPKCQTTKNGPDLELVRLRFVAKVRMAGPGECWLWTGAKSDSGYGSFRWGRTQCAHRVAWMLAHGCDVPVGMDIMHSCDTPLCCNPAHLSPGTAKANLQQASRRGRLRVGRPNNRSLPSEDIAAIRAYVTENRKGVRDGVLTEAARVYGVTQSYVSMLMRGVRRQYDGQLPTELERAV